MIAYKIYITLEQGVELVWHAFDDMLGGEIYVKIPSMRVVDLAKVVAPKASHKIVGIRPGEKLHEQMVGLEDAHFTYEYDNYYKILPQINGWYKDPNRIKMVEKLKKILCIQVITMMTGCLRKSCQIG